MTVRLTGRLICANADDAAIVERFLPAHIALTRNEPGCLAFDVARSADPLIWLVAETFADRAAFEAHQTRTAASDWFAQTRHIPRVYDVTED